jgi:hemerythrin-like metal-binding protein
MYGHPMSSCLRAAFVNDLHDAIVYPKADTSSDAAKKVILQMVDYAMHHFAREENYMIRFNYPGGAQHKKEHADFLAGCSMKKA